VHTFLFADLAGFTAFTEAHGDERAADLVAAFCGALRGLLPDHRAEEVKAIGDAMMLRSPDAGLAIELGLRAVHDVGAQHGFPGVRAGMHTGHAVERKGDWYGATVNVAARVADVAGGGEVVATEATIEAAGRPHGIELRARGRHRLRNVAEPVAIFTVLRAGERGAKGLPIDPVCRMAVDPARAAGTLVHGGTQHHFCSLACAQTFAAHPERYAAP
jgi:adenylate cyclase